jgi:predicted GIY-YIG superfamily endonuclease
VNIVYILKSLKDPKRHYIGITVDLERRLKEHNSKQSSYSSVYAPWELETYVVFKDRSLALDFERYLKHGSGSAFLKKRLIGAK